MSTLTKISFNSNCVDFNGKPVYVEFLYKMGCRLFAFTENGWFSVIEGTEYKIVPLFYSDDEYNLNIALYDLDKKEFLAEQENGIECVLLNPMLFIILVILVFLSLL